MSNKGRKTCDGELDCLVVDAAAPAGTIKDCKVIKVVATGTADLAVDGSAYVYGLVYSKDCPDKLFEPGDSVEVQTDGWGLAVAGAAIVAGDLVIADANGDVVPGAGFIVGMATHDAVVGQKVQIEINRISV